MSPFGKLALPVPKSLKKLSDPFGGSNSSSLEQSISPTLPAMQTTRTIDWAESGTGEAGAWIVPAPEQNRRLEFINALSGTLKDGGLCTMWPATEYAMRKHPNMEAAEAAAISQGPAAWCAERIPHMAPSPRSVNTRNMTKEEMAITECPWGDVHGQCKRSPSADKSLSVKGDCSIKGEDSNDSDGASSHAPGTHPAQIPSIERSPWEEESSAFPTKNTPGLSSQPAFEDVSLEDSSAHWS